MVSLLLVSLKRFTSIIRFMQLDPLCYELQMLSLVFALVRTRRNQQGRVRATAAIQPISQQNEELPGASN